jgi:hypothetical protein
MKLRATFVADVHSVYNSTGYQAHNIEKIVFESVRDGFKEVTKDLRWDTPIPKAMVKGIEKARKKHQFEGFKLFAEAFGKASVSEMKA